MRTELACWRYRKIADPEKRLSMVSLIVSRMKLVKIHAGLRAPLAVFVVFAGLISICQADYINADFVAYSTVAHRAMEWSATSVTGSWSPLFSWLMIPLLALGIPDLIAGRIVLLVSGPFYIVAVHRLARKFFPPETCINRLMIQALMTCATVQAIWFSTYLLNPDLLASAIIFWYFVAVVDGKTARNPQRSFLAGMILGMAYLAKAYMLPFGIAQLIVSTASNLVFTRKRDASVQPTLGLTSFVSLMVGLGIVAGPWIMILTQKYDRLTFTNAGRANHANVGPAGFGKDLLWHPPLTQDYILEPVIAQEWSPFASFDNFGHQVRVVLHNTANCIGLIPTWLALAGLAFAGWLARWRQIGSHPGTSLAVWAVLTAAVYCSGYLTVNLETRYIVPIVAPLLCLFAAGIVSAMTSEPTRISALQWIRDASRSAGDERRRSIAIVSVVIGFAVVDIYSIVCVAVFHPQSSNMAKFRAIARQLDAEGIADQLNASDRYHDGLFIAYARGNVSNYLGSPQATEQSDLAKELISKGVHLSFHWDSDRSQTNSHIAGIWNRRLKIVDRSLSAPMIEVYIR